MNDSAPSDAAPDRVECVVQEYPPQRSTSQLGAQIANFIIHSDQFHVEAILHSGKKKATSCPWTERGGEGSGAYFTTS